MNDQVFRIGHFAGVQRARGELKNIAIETLLVHVGNHRQLLLGVRDGFSSEQTESTVHGRAFLRSIERHLSELGSE